MAIIPALTIQNGTDTRIGNSDTLGVGNGISTSSGNISISSVGGTTMLSDTVVAMSGDFGLVAGNNFTSLARFQLESTTASTSGTKVQESPPLIFTGRGWTGTNDSVSAFIYGTPVVTDGANAGINLNFAQSPTNLNASSPLLAMHMNQALALVELYPTNTGRLGTASLPWDKTFSNKFNELTLAAQTVGFTIAGGTTSKTLTVALDANVAGTNTGDVTKSGENYISLSGQAITANAVDLSGTNATGTLAAGRFPALLGDVTTSAGSLTTAIGANKVTTSTIADSNVTLAKIASIADQTILGNNSGGSAAPSALSASTVKTVLSLNNVENTALSTGTSGSTNALKSATTTVNVSSATAPTSGQVLTATDSTHATWVAPATSPTRVNVSSSVTLTDNSFNLVDTSSSALSLALPNPTTTTGFIYIKDKTGNAQTNNITVTQFSAETIEGTAASYVIQANWASLTFVSDGTNWVIL